MNVQQLIEQATTTKPTTENDELNDILNEYLAEDDLSHSNLVRWVRMFPKYSNELIDFSVACIKLRHQ